MGCASSAEEKEANSYGPVAGRQKQFIESVNPNYGAPAMDDSPKVALRAQGSGVRRALLAGCNYPGNQYELHGCIRDVQQIQGVLQQNYGYEDVLLMVDDGSTTSRPTGAVLKDALGSLLRSGQPGDILLFYFSGHGTQGVDPNSKDPYRPGVEDEAIVPTDFNLIFNEDLRALVNEKLQPDVMFIMISDSCHSGNMLEQESPAASRREVKQQVGGRYMPANAILQVLANQHGFDPASGSLASHLVNLFKGAASNHSKRLFGGHGYELSRHTGAPGEDLRIVLVSGCRANETSEELPGPDGKTDGALTAGILQVAGFPGNLTYREVVTKVTHLIAERNIVQHPTLEVNSQRDANSPFLQPENATGPGKTRSEVEAYVAKGVPPVGFSVEPIKGYSSVSYNLDNEY